MADSWFIEKNAKRLGPFTIKELRELAVMGRLERADRVWQEGRGPVAAASVAGLLQRMMWRIGQFHLP